MPIIICDGGPMDGHEEARSDAPPALIVFGYPYRRLDDWQQEGKKVVYVSAVKFDGDNDEDPELGDRWKKE